MLAHAGQIKATVTHNGDFEIPTYNDNLKEAVEGKLEHFIKNIPQIGEKYVEMMPDNNNEKVIEIIMRVIDDLKLVELHFTLTLELLKVNSNKEICLTKEKFSQVSQPYSSIKNNTDISLVPTDEALDKVVKEVFGDLEAIVEDFHTLKKAKKEVEQDTEILSHMRIVASKLENILEYFPAVVTLPKTDLFSQSKSSAVWQKLYSDAQFKEFVNKKEVQKSIKKFCSMLTIVNAVIYKKEKVKEKTDSKTLANVASALSGIYYSAVHEKAETRASLFFSDPKMESAFKVWNLPDNKWVKELYKLRLQSIEYDNKIYVPKMFPRITRESILKEYTEGTLNKITPNEFEPPNLTPDKKLILKTLFKKDPERVKIRILAPWPLVIKGQNMEKMKVKINEIKKKVMFKEVNMPDFARNINGVVIHIHGGGFVSMSSSSHRNYLIRWANSLNMVIFSIDYGLAPEHQYPEPIDDIWQAYNWLINYSGPILGIPTDRIVLTGDSAGGNLTMSIALRAIKEGVRVPDGLLLSYPALNLYPEKFVPSYFVALDDVILPYNVLKLCLKAYIPQEFRPDTDPFLSPIVASDELLSKLPRIKIVTGTDDPLHDDIWKLVNRLQDLEKEVNITVYNDLPHGFLSFDELKGYDLIIADTVSKIQELFYISEKGF